MGTYAELVGAALEVVVDLVAPREVVGERVTAAERVRVGVVGGVDAAAGRAVVPPRAADGLALLDDRVRHPGAAERRAERDAADAGTDDDHVRTRDDRPGWRHRARRAARRAVRRAGRRAVRRAVRRAGRRAGRRAVRRAGRRIVADEAELAAHQRRVLGRHLLAEAHGHHALHQLVPRVVDRRAGHAVDQQLPDRVADAVADRVGKAGSGVGHQADVARRLEGWFQPGQVTGEMDQAHQQQAQVGPGERSSNPSALVPSARRESWGQHVMT